MTKREELDKIMSEQTADVPKITKALADWIMSQELSVGQSIIALSATTAQILSTLPDDIRRDMMYKIFTFIAVASVGKKS